MWSRWLAVSLSALVLVVAHPGAARSGDRIDYPDRTPEGLVGDGRCVVRVRPHGYEFHSGGDDSARFRLVVEGEAHELASREAGATFFPGGVVYTVGVAGLTADILHGSIAGVPYLAAIRVRGARAPVELEIASRGRSPASTAGRVPFPLADGAGQVVLALGAPPPTGTWDELRDRIEAPYRTGLRLTTPAPTVDRAVPFSRALLDLGFDGRMHVCELFRWRDVWSRDLGSGLAPGAMASGRFAAAFATIAYDLERHAKADPRGLKVTQDPSQGGTAEGVAWLTRAVWRQYLLTGDERFLRESERTLRPWVDAWLDRDADGRGLIVDVSEWMDHSRFFLFPDGARVLYSNVLFAELLHRFARIEEALGDPDAAAGYRFEGDRFVRGINRTLWDEPNGMYDNLELWGRRDERATSAENALAVLCGVAPADRATRALATVRERNWRVAGSTTIVPPMTHVPAYIDHNFRFWPWWNAVEARARFRIGDREGAVHLLERCAATLEDEHYPGMMEELTTPEGVTEGGFAFLTAAGSYLDAVVEGLLGVEVLEPGCARLRVAPNVPAGWHDWSAEVPLPQGAIVITVTRGRLDVRVTDPRVRVVEVPRGATVTGAKRATLAQVEYPVLPDTGTYRPMPLPSSRPRTAAVYVAEMAPAPALTAPLSRRVTTEDLLALDPAEVGALVVVGNALPRRTAAGADVPAALARYLDAGGALVFYGATMAERGTMGETGGVIEWYEPRAWVRYAPTGGWTFRTSRQSARVARDDERGLLEGWSRATDRDTGWTAIPVPAPWERPLGEEYDGWGWYRARFTLPADARGRTIAVDLGRVDDRDWTFVNGHPIGATADWQAIRHYRIRPGEPAYDALVFGGTNTLAVQVLDTGGGGGLYVDVPRVGAETDSTAWMPIDPKSGEVASQPIRHGVVSWGPGGAFFNSWETSRGAFGFRIEGHRVDFERPRFALPVLDIDVAEAFTDFAVSRPWRFEPLAFTTTHRGWLHPDRGERYPCMARLVNTETRGEIVLVPASIARTIHGPRVLEQLGIGGER